MQSYIISPATSLLRLFSHLLMVTCWRYFVPC